MTMSAHVDIVSDLFLPSSYIRFPEPTQQIHPILNMKNKKKKKEKKHCVLNDSSHSKKSFQSLKNKISRVSSSIEIYQSIVKALFDFELKLVRKRKPD